MIIRSLHDKKNVNANVFEMEEFGNHLMVRPI